MSVSLRCANCGTTQNHPGECEACLEGEVRYFCSNHNPGLWLSEPVCGRCGAKYGDAKRIEPELSTRSTPAVPVSRSRRPETPPPRPDGGMASRPARPSRSPASREGSEEIPATPTLRDLLAALSERTRSRRRVEEEVWTDSPVDRGSRGLPVMGCLFRLVLFLLMAIVLVLTGFYGLLSDMGF